MWHPQWEPLWAAIDEVGIPLHFHTFPSVSPDLREKYTGLTQPRADVQRPLPVQMTLANILTALMGRAVFERYPNLRIAFGESGIGWIPYVLDRMDSSTRTSTRISRSAQAERVLAAPVQATFQYDRVGTKLIEEMGVETLMWAPTTASRRRLGRSPRSTSASSSSTCRTTWSGR